jgi:hypothetical protein
MLSFTEYAKSLGVSAKGKEALLQVFKQLGYEDEDVFESVVIDHPLAKLSFDYGLIRYGENNYGMVVCIDEVCEENLERLSGICKLVGARYGVLTDLKDLSVIKIEGFRHEFVNEIPQSDALKIELGLMEVGAITIDYDEFEKVDDVNFVVENSSYIYSDMNNDEVVIILPSGRLLGWLRRRNVKFRILNEEQTGKAISKFFFF